MIIQFLYSATIALCIGVACTKKTIDANNNNMNTNNSTQKPITILALGDSYTIGESVGEIERFPAQTVQWLQLNTTYSFNPIVYVAKTGFTCEELEQAIELRNIQDTFSVVTLLIGVNDQYRGYNINLYENRFKNLLQRAISFANNKPQKVFVVSIPDWGVTPFAANRNKATIAAEIDAYNAINKKVAIQLNTNYINITNSTREAETDASLIATDGLHPSGKEYKKWALLLGPLIKEKVLLQ